VSVAGLQQQIKRLFILVFEAAFNSLFKWGTTFMRVHTHWLECDAAAWTFLIVGVAAVGLLVMIV
jgi:hypothetical protein